MDGRTDGLSTYDSNTALALLKAGQPLELLGNFQVPMDDVVIEATKFTATCYGVNVKAGEDMSDVRVEVWSRKIGKKNITSAPELKSLPPTSEAFRENVKRAHIQAAIWKSCLQPDRYLLMPPSTSGFVMRRVKSLFP